MAAFRGSQDLNNTDEYTDLVLQYKLLGTSLVKARVTLEAKYADLPALPGPIPQPRYIKPCDTETSTNCRGIAPRFFAIYSTDPASCQFYSDCAHGILNEVRDFLRNNPKASPANMEYALEEAAQHLQVKVTHLLLTAGVRTPPSLHARVFERTDSIEASTWPPQSIFTSESPELLELLKVFIDHGWHPNQVWLSLPGDRPINRGYRHPREPLHNVALHFPRCLRDIAILRLLLGHGADPTIGRHGTRYHCFSTLDERDQPVGRKDGFILNLAVRVATVEAVDLLLAHGARIEYGQPLHSLCHRHPDLGPRHHKDPPEPPSRPERFDMADHLVALGADVNASHVV